MASVIKASGPTATYENGSFNFDDMGRRAQNYLDTVRAQAAEILAKAREEAVAIANQAQEQGRAAALQAAERVLDEKVGKQLTTLVPALQATIKQIEASKADWLAHWEKIGVHVAAAIAGRIARKELEKTPDITLSLIREALELAAGKGDVQLRMHPDDVAALRGSAERLASELGRLGSVAIVPDTAISKGGCRIDTRFGAIDQQFEAQLARIEEELT